MRADISGQTRANSGRPAQRCDALYVTARASYCPVAGEYFISDDIQLRLTGQVSVRIGECLSSPVVTRHVSQLHE